MSWAGGCSPVPPSNSDRKASMTLTRLPALAALVLLAGAAPAGPAVPVTPFAVGALSGTLRSDTQTLARLSPAGEPGFSFVPTAREAERAGDGYDHVGDIDIRLRSGGGPWRDFALGASSPADPAVAGGGAARSPRRTSPRPWATASRSPSSGAGSTAGGALGLRFTPDQPLARAGRDRRARPADGVRQYHHRPQPRPGACGGELRRSLYRPRRRLSAGDAAQRPGAGAARPARAAIRRWRRMRRSRCRDAPAGGVFTDRSAARADVRGLLRLAGPAAASPTASGAAPANSGTCPPASRSRPAPAARSALRLVTAPSIRAIEHDAGRAAAPGRDRHSRLCRADRSAGDAVRPRARRDRRDRQQPGGRAVGDARDGTVQRLDAAGGDQPGFGPARLTLALCRRQRQTVSYYVTSRSSRRWRTLGRFATTRQWYRGQGRSVRPRRRRS